MEKRKTVIRASRKKVEAYGLLGACLAAMVSFLVAPFLLEYTHIREASLQSLGIIIGSAVVLVTFAAFVVGTRYAPEEAHFEGRLRRFRAFIRITTFAFVHAAVTFLLLVAVSELLANYIKGLKFDDASITVIGSTVAALGFYLAFVTAANMNSYRLVGSLLAFIGAGVLASIVTAGDNGWWTHHFSALGAGHSSSSYAFNLTMILGGITIAGLADYLVHDLESIEEIENRHARIRSGILKIIFIYIGLSMIGVALFPYDRFLDVHNICGYGIGVGFGLLVMMLPWLVPIFSRVFYAFSYMLVALVVYVNYAWWHDGRISFLMFELAAAFAFFIWLVLFVRQINAATLDLEQSVKQAGLPISVHVESSKK